MITDKVIDNKSSQMIQHMDRKCSWNRESKKCRWNYSKIFLMLNFLKWREKIQAVFRLLQRNIHCQKIRDNSIFNSDIINKRHKNVENVALNRPQEGNLFTVWELKQVDTALPCLISAGMCASSDSNFSLLHACLWMITNVSWVWIWELQVHFSK